MYTKPISEAACTSAIQYGKNGYCKQTLRDYEAIEYKKRSLFSDLQNSLISRPMQIRTNDEVKLVCDIIAALLYTNYLDDDTRPSKLCEMLMERYGIVDFYKESFDIPFEKSINFLYALQCGKYFLPEQEICCMFGKTYCRNEEHIFKYEEEIIPF